MTPVFPPQKSRREFHTNILPLLLSIVKYFVVVMPGTSALRFRPSST
jgi:hypothetical protein